MIKKLNIDNIVIVTLGQEINGVRVRSGNENVLFEGQDIEGLSRLIIQNLKVVENYYGKLVSNAKTLIELKDIYSVSLSIVLHYLYMYNTWQISHRKLKIKDLSFNKSDFDNPSTHDIIFHYFKSRYEDDWKIKSATLLNVELDELEGYYKTRKQFYCK